jgi:hypothetical protein
MPLTPTVPCQLRSVNLGWLLTFPEDPDSGLLFTDIDEQLEFARDCAIQLHHTEVDSTWLVESIVRCPTHWYSRAKVFSDSCF